ncbi:MAG: tRNA (adenosine(37)-N6)-dimethylallyltransferase MiaA, partial [Verrucomicrobia bacterium]|nr:tRNA (adenosine(37)-N6)-dimethylallyltransferase MiaA [Verrucomicrobiota bacterium]
ADAFQVYAGLDLLSAKPSKAQRQQVPHHLVDFVPLARCYDAFQYGQDARAAIAAVNAAGKVPLVVGGTGFYLEALTSRLPEFPPADPGLRAELESAGHHNLVARLQALDPEGYARIDLRNPRRVLRAVEICLQTGTPFSSFRIVPESFPPSFCLSRPRPALQRQINSRVERMFAEGVVQEVATAGPIGPTAAKMIGLAAIRDLLAGKISEAECVCTIQRQSRHYARRQETWFRSRGFTPVPVEDAGSAIGHALDALAP